MFGLESLILMLKLPNIINLMKVNIEIKTELFFFYLIEQIMCNGMETTLLLGDEIIKAFNR